MDLLKKIYHLLGLLLTLLITPILIYTVYSVIDFYLPKTPCGGLQLPYIPPPPVPWYEDYGNILLNITTVITIMALVTFIVGILYLLIGCIRFVKNRFSQKGKKLAVRLLFTRGVIAISIAILFNIVELAIGIFRICL